MTTIPSPDIAGAVERLEPYWLLESPRGEWLVCCRVGDQQPTVTRDHTRAWRFSSKFAADECRKRVLWLEWQDAFQPTEHADSLNANTRPQPSGEGLVQARRKHIADQEERLKAYLQDYEFRGDTDYQPNEQEQLLIEDALRGWVAEEDAIAAHQPHDMHGGYGECNGLGAVWVDDGEASGFYRQGSCPRCTADQPPSREGSA